MPPSSAARSLALASPPRGQYVARAKHPVTWFNHASGSPFHEVRGLIRAGRSRPPNHPESSIRGSCPSVERPIVSPFSGTIRPRDTSAEPASDGCPSGLSAPRWTTHVTRGWHRSPCLWEPDQPVSHERTTLLFSLHRVFAALPDLLRFFWSFFRGFFS